MEKRSPFLAVLFALLFPGLGLFYLRKKRLAILYHIIYIAACCFLNLFVIRFTSYGVCFLVLITLIWMTLSPILTISHLKTPCTIVEGRAKKWLLRLVFLGAAALSCLINTGDSVSSLFGLGKTLLLSSLSGSELQAGDCVVWDSHARLNINDIVVYEGKQGLSISTVLQISDDGILVRKLQDLDRLIKTDKIKGKALYVFYSSSHGKTNWNRFPKYISQLTEKDRTVLEGETKRSTNSTNYLTAPAKQTERCGRNAFSYPPFSYLSNHEGKTRLIAFIDINGNLKKSEVTQSSGDRLLDIATQSGFAQCDFIPGIREGQPIESAIEIEFTWRLQTQPRAANDSVKTSINLIKKGKVEYGCVSSETGKCFFSIFQDHCFEPYNPSCTDVKYQFILDEGEFIEYPLETKRAEYCVLEKEFPKTMGCNH